MRRSPVYADHRISGVAPDRRPRADLTLEAALWQAGFRLIAGLDEAGRGAWAGPLVAAAVILPADRDALAPLLGAVDDSKKLAAAERERLSDVIHGCAVAVGVGSVSASEIDALGIAAANRLALRRAVEALATPPDYLLLDYLTLPDLSLPQHGVPHGDARSIAIASASIIAKVTRDRLMFFEDRAYPGYGFARHKGYGTTMHRDALARLGPCPLHRRSYAPVKECYVVKDQTC
ncbi:MAG: ribonuclease HII [Anaerolineae bacterium]